MKINWKLRFMNKTTLTAIVLAIISLVYKILNLAGIIPEIEQQEIINVVLMVIDLLVLLGIVIDPTTAGISDSTQALSYDEPRVSDRNA